MYSISSNSTLSSYFGLSPNFYGAINVYYGIWMISHNFLSTELANSKSTAVQIWQVPWITFERIWNALKKDIILDNFCLYNFQFLLDVPAKTCLSLCTSRLTRIPYTNNQLETNILFYFIHFNLTFSSILFASRLCLFWIFPKIK